MGAEREATMTDQQHTSRRSVLRTLGVGGGIVLGSRSVTADHGGDHPDPTFFARLSDNPSIPGHDKVGSKGRGRLDVRGESRGGDTVLHYELSVANLEQGTFAAHIHGEGRADGPIWVPLYEGEPFNEDTVSGTISDGDVDDAVGDVATLVWDELVEGTGVVNVHTGFEPGGEIAGVVRPRPVGGWIQV